jgi:hypothetical protein
VHRHDDDEIFLHLLSSRQGGVLPSIHNLSRRLGCGFKIREETGRLIFCPCLSDAQVVSESLGKRWRPSS